MAVGYHEHVYHTIIGGIRSAELGGPGQEYLNNSGLTILKGAHKSSPLINPSVDSGGQGSSACTS